MPPRVPLAGMARLSIINGRVIDPGTGRDERADVVLEDGKVAEVGGGGRVSRPDSPTFDASGCIVSPGLIDPHVHLREPGGEEKETIASGAAAAVHGGFTSICCMPNTHPALDDEARIEFVYRQAQRAGLCHVFPVGAITKGRAGETLAEIGLMAKGGAVALSDDGVAVASPGIMRKALQYAAMVGRPIMQHCEEPTLTAGASMNAGETAIRCGLGGWPGVAEELIIERDLRLNREIGCRYHVQHVSTAGGVEILRRARADGMGEVTAEVTPHHLLLTDACCASYDTSYKVNPPLRTQVDVEALRQGVAEGLMTILATDHAPHTREDKEREFAAAPFGIIGLESALPLYVRALIETQALDWPRLLGMMTIHPARLCGLTSKGTLESGADADVTIIDPHRRWTIDAERFASKSRNCPFHGWEVTGRAVATIVAGEVKMCREEDRWVDSKVGTPEAQRHREG